MRYLAFELPQVKTSLYHLVSYYQVSHVVVDLGWVDFDLRVPPFDQAAQALLPNSHQPHGRVRQRGENSKSYKPNPGLRPLGTP